MTDADVDGREQPSSTLVADAAFREDAGAIEGRLRLHRQATPLYKLKAGRSRALHRKGLRAGRRSCLADKWDKIDIFDRYRRPAEAHEARLGKRFFRGCSSSTRGW